MPAPSKPADPLTQLRARCEPHKNTLRRSAMFALSRGGKELFHTNFLAFVLELDVASLDEVDRPVVNQVQRALLTRLFGPNPPERITAWREARRLDLVLAAFPEADKQGRPQLRGGAVLEGRPRRSAKGQAPTVLGVSLVVIEAKLKALPDADQLRRYDDVLVNGIVLTLDQDVRLTDSDQTRIWGRLVVQNLERKSGRAVLRAYPPVRFHDSGDEGIASGRCFATGHSEVRRHLLAPEDPMGTAGAAGWNFLPWSALLADFHVPGAGLGGAVAAMLRDYADSTQALMSVVREVADFVRQSYAEKGKSLRLDAIAAVPDDFRLLRIHDVAGKYAFSVLQEALAKSLDANAITPNVDKLEAYCGNLHDPGHSWPLHRVRA